MPYEKNFVECIGDALIEDRCGKIILKFEVCLPISRGKDFDIRSLG